VYHVLKLCISCALVLYTTVNHLLVAVVRLYQKSRSPVHSFLANGKRDGVGGGEGASSRAGTAANDTRSGLWAATGGTRERGDDDDGLMMAAAAAAAALRCIGGISFLFFSSRRARAPRPRVVL
jgi:hypothetical protein